jgi:hypothetical protein
MDAQLLISIPIRSQKKLDNPYFYDSIEKIKILKYNIKYRLTNSLMTDSLKNQINEKQGLEGFIKITDNPVGSLTSEQKAFLNRKGNVLYNENAIEEARRIFTTTGYSDGLTRIGDKYMEKNKSIPALKEYVLAHNKKKAEPLYDSLAKIISVLLKEN